MKPLLILNENDFEPTDYSDLKKVRMVITNDKGQILLFGGMLVGGGVENGETDEQAMAREALEEVGAQIEILSFLGTAIQYRDALKKKYILNGYHCRFLKTISAPTTTDLEELKSVASWEDPHETIARLKKEIADITALGKEHFSGDDWQRKLFNRMATKTFLEIFLQK